MSGKPSQAGVREVRRLAQEIATLSSRQDYLAREIVEKESRLKQTNESLETLRAKLKNTLEGMDVAASGNSGWEQRIMFFFAEIDRQYREELTPKQLEVPK